MAREAPAPGRLIGVEGSRGADVAAEADALVKRLRARGVDAAISRWDASGLFAELLLGDAADVVLSPRMLALLYATDLVFRLRWEIQPALAHGRVVVAAPYVSTAIGVGIGVGLPEAWLREVLRFAPAAAITRPAKERKPDEGWQPKADRGFGEYCASVLGSTSPGFKRRAARARAMAWLAEASPKTRRKEIVDGLAGYEHPAGKAEPSARAASQRT